MAVYKEEKTDTWRVICRYTNRTGEREQTQKRGFKLSVIFNHAVCCYNLQDNPCKKAGSMERRKTAAEFPADCSV